MKVLVCGSRSWADVEAIRERLRKLPRGTTIVHGAARGADQLAGTVAGQLGLTMLAFPINDDDRLRAGSTRLAPIFRNLRMLDEPHIDLVLAFWDGTSSGTAQALHEARRRGIPVEIVEAIRVMSQENGGATTEANPTGTPPLEQSVLEGSA